MTLSNNDALISAFKEQSDDVWLVFLTIDHPDLLGGPLRLVRNTKAVNRIIDGNTIPFEGMMFDINLPADLEKELSSTNITVPNVDRAITDKLRGLIGKEPAVVTIEVSIATDPNSIQFGPFELDLANVKWTVATVTGDLSPALFLSQSWPKLRFDNTHFPGLFPG